MHRAAVREGSGALAPSADGAAAGTGVPDMSRVTLHYAGGAAALMAARRAAHAVGLTGTSTVATLGTWRDDAGEIVVEDSFATTLVGPDVLGSAADVAAAIFAATAEHAVLLELWDSAGYDSVEIAREALEVTLRQFVARRLTLKAPPVTVLTSPLQAAA
jgi:hypothetical protein